MPELNLAVAADLLSIVLIDLILAGDNAVVIALAVRNLPPRQRGAGIALGAGAAVILRVGLTFVAAQLLETPLIKLAGGALIAWIGVKLFVDAAPDPSGRKECRTMFQAMTTIIVADLVMSTDNILAVAGASKGDPFLLIFGLGLSIPFVVFTSTLLTRLMDRFPWVTVLGAAVLGKVAAEMALTDPWTVSRLAPDANALVAAQVLAAVGVVVTGRIWLRLKVRTRGPSTPA